MGSLASTTCHLHNHRLLLTMCWMIHSHNTRTRKEPVSCRGMLLFCEGKYVQLCGGMQLSDLCRLIIRKDGSVLHDDIKEM